ncbi:homocysteine S-methyltransferase [uncultured Microbacterium sp.]|uniref:homocysteine S-methyltransferase n=1 Tax=uncultured Microbacterium sp. TaxID=191216 RepID=UPI0028D58A54|nr:homocysteine S-methyltransferase [uncultured Microbacterium sp.]
MSSFADALADGPVVLDGGLGSLLEAHGRDLSSSLWSARLLLDEPDAIRRAHAEYFAAGARVAISSSYQVSYAALEEAGVDRSGTDDLLVRSVELARQARADSGLTPEEAWVAASVGPYGASLADGSEYTGDYGLDVTQLREWHRPRLHALVAAEPDAIAIETVPSLAELEALCTELVDVGVPAWVSVTVADGRLRSGESLAEAFALAAALPEVVAIGVNCCDTAEVGAALTALGGRRPGVAYPNSGEMWHAGARTWSGEASAIAASAGGWVDGGARLVGGCCRVGPDQINQIARALAGRAQ